MENENATYTYKVEYSGIKPKKEPLKSRIAEFLSDEGCSSDFEIDLDTYGEIKISAQNPDPHFNYKLGVCIGSMIGISRIVQLYTYTEEEINDMKLLHFATDVGYGG